MLPNCFLYATNLQSISCCSLRSGNSWPAEAADGETEGTDAAPAPAPAALLDCPKLPPAAFMRQVSRAAAVAKATQVLQFPWDLAGVTRPRSTDM